MTRETTIDLRNLYRREDIRTELQILRKRIKAREKHHLDEANGPRAQAGLFYLQHIAAVCLMCNRLDGQLDAIDEALRLFGGRTPTAEPGKKRPDFAPQMPVDEPEAAQ